MICVFKLQYVVIKETQLLFLAGLFGFFSFHYFKQIHHNFMYSTVTNMHCLKYTTIASLVNLFMWLSPILYRYVHTFLPDRHYITYSCERKNVNSTVAEKYSFLWVAALQTINPKLSTGLSKNSRNENLHDSNGKTVVWVKLTKKILSRWAT